MKNYQEMCKTSPVHTSVQKVEQEMHLHQNMLILCDRTIYAVNTRFRKRKKSPTTYLQVKTAGDPVERFVGRSVKTTWKKQEIYGKVTRQISKGKWKVKFEDNYEMTVGEGRLQDMLVIRQGEIMQGKQIDVKPMDDKCQRYRLV